MAHIRKNDVIKFRADEASAEILSWMRRDFGLSSTATIRFALVQLNMTARRGAAGDPAAAEIIAKTRDALRQIGVEGVSRRGRPKKGHKRT